MTERNCRIRNKKNDCYDFYLGHEDYGVKDFMIGELRKNCTPNNGRD